MTERLQIGPQNEVDGRSLDAVRLYEYGGSRLAVEGVRCSSGEAHRSFTPYYCQPRGVSLVRLTRCRSTLGSNAGTLALFSVPVAGRMAWWLYRYNLRFMLQYITGREFVGLYTNTETVAVYFPESGQPAADSGHIVPDLQDFTWLEWGDVRGVIGLFHALDQSGALYQELRFRATPASAWNTLPLSVGDQIVGGLRNCVHISRPLLFQKKPCVVVADRNGACLILELLDRGGLSARVEMAVRNDTIHSPVGMEVDRVFGLRWCSDQERIVATWGEQRIEDFERACERQRVRGQTGLLQRLLWSPAAGAEGAPVATL